MLINSTKVSTSRNENDIIRYKKRININCKYILIRIIFCRCNIPRRTKKKKVKTILICCVDVNVILIDY